jgi:putative ABC transport system ATP-binding protein
MRQPVKVRVEINRKLFRSISRTSEESLWTWPLVLQHSILVSDGRCPLMALHPVKRDIQTAILFATHALLAHFLSVQMSSNGNIVSIRNLSKVYQQGDINVTALNNISLDIRSGEFLTLMGPSGSGKSTLLHIVAGIDRPTSGGCHVQGIDVGKLNESQLADWRNHNVGFVFQTFNLIPVLTAYENIELPLLLTRLSRVQRRKQVETALELVGLADRARHLPRQLSGGQEQRTAIARALVTDPALIVADEPTGNLDSHSATDVLTVLQSLSRDAGKTVIMVTHDPKAAAYGTRTIHLEKGELME